MCGFVGFTNKINDASIVLGKMMDRIKHRGPDSDGKYVDEQIAMGFRRLSIIDLSDKVASLSSMKISRWFLHSTVRYTTTRISVRSL